MKFTKFIRKSLLITIETFMVLTVLLLIGAGVVVWKLNQGPIEVAFAEKFIESELSDPAAGLAMNVDKIYLSWSAIDSRPQITMKQARMINRRTGQVAFSVESASVTLSRQALLFGHVAPRTIMVQNPLLTVIHDEFGRFRLAWESGQKEKSESVSPEDQGELLAAFLEKLAAPSKNIPRDWPFRSLRIIMIDGARVMVQDQVIKQSWLIPRADLAFRRGSGSLITTASLWLEDIAEPVPTLKAEVAYKGDAGNILMDVALTKLRLGYLAEKFPGFAYLNGQNFEVNGKAQVELDGKLSVDNFEATIEAGAGQIAIPDLYDQPITLQGILVNAAYSRSTGALVIKNSTVSIAEDFRFDISGSANPVDEGRSYNIPLTINVHKLSQQKVAGMWPKILKGDSSEEWAVKRLADGYIQDSVINLQLTASQAENKWTVDLADITAAFNIFDMTVDYSAPLMPVKKARGKGVYEYVNDRLTIDVQSGVMGDLDIKSGKIVIDTVLGEAVGKASIDAHLAGPLKTVFRYINSDPIAVARDIGTDISKIEGTADLRINVSFPTLADLPADKIKVVAEGTADRVLMPGLVNNLDISGGPVKVVVRDERVDVRGKGRIDGRDMDFVYDQFFESKGKDYAMRVVADLMADSDLRLKFGIDLSDWIEGSVPVKVTYTDYAGGRAEVDAVVDATPATLMVKPMNYVKAPGVKSSASARAYLKNNILTDVKDLRIETPEGRVDGASMTFMQKGKETLLKTGAFPQARLNESDVAIKFDISDQNVISMSIQGSFLDARPFLENNKKGEDYNGPGLVANVSAARMRTANARIVEQAKILFDMDKVGEIRRLEMEAMAGRGPVLFRYRPDNAGIRMLLNIDAEDAGAALQAFDVYENTRGGKLRISGESKPGGDKKIIIGRAELTDFRVINAPVLARLVNAMSLTGIFSLLGSDGIDFARLESDFTWEKRKDIDMISVSDGRTSGSSMGLTFEGNLDRMADTLNIEGTIVPASMVNGLISSIPIIGDILTGGSGVALFAATYSVTGPAKNPSIMVNPLAVLAPGFLRQIFFE